MIVSIATKLEEWEGNPEFGPRSGITGTKDSISGVLSACWLQLFPLQTRLLSEAECQ